MTADLPPHHARIIRRRRLLTRAAYLLVALGAVGALSAVAESDWLRVAAWIVVVASQVQLIFTQRETQMWHDATVELERAHRP